MRGALGIALKKGFQSVFMMRMKMNPRNHWNVLLKVEKGE